MNSTELPVTEWWDPEWDVYDVPLTPFDDGWRNPVMPEQIDLWWTAYCHLWMLRWVMNGSAEYIPADFQHQLTTGHDRFCPARYGADEECAGAMPGSCEDVDPTPPACWCRYALLPVDGVTGTHPLDPFRHAWKRGVYAFRIHPRCPHHGDGNACTCPPHIDGIGREKWPDCPVHTLKEPRAWQVLDDDERRGH